MLHAKSERILVISLLLCGFLNQGSPIAQITTNVRNQTNPAIYSMTVVWEDDRNGNYDIYGLNLVTGEEIQVTTNVDNQYDPEIYGDTVVWMDERNGNVDIYGVNLVTSEEFQITADPNDQINPAIYDNFVVWEDFRNGNWDIYGFNLLTREEFQITTNESSQKSPAIYSNFVVWSDFRNGNWDVYGLNLVTSEEFQITTDAADQTNPVVYDNYVVWEDSRNGNPDIYGYSLDMGQEFQITTDANPQENPAIYSNFVIWEDLRNGNYDIYGVNLQTLQETQIETDPALQRDPAIYEGIIIWEDSRNLNYDIYSYGYTLPEVSTFTVTVAVKDSDGNPVSKASITLGPYTGVTDETGVAVISVEPGTYTLVVTAPGFQEDTQLIEIGENRTIDVTLTGESTEPSKFTVEVAVQDASGNPVQGAVVVLTGPATYTAPTDILGNAVLTEVVTGTYTLTVSHPDYGTYTDSAFNVNTATTTTVVLNRGMGFIHGTVYWDTTATPARNVTVQIYDQITNILEKSVKTDSEGRFIAEVPKPKKYSIVVEGFPEQKQIEITPADSLDTGEVMLILDSQSGVQGLVKDHSGEEIAGASVVISENSQPIAQGTTDSSGVFSIKVKPGTYTLEVSVPDYQSFIQPFSVSYKKVYDFGIIALKEKPRIQIEIQEENPPTDEEVTKPSPSKSVMIPVLITLTVCIAVVLVVIVREKNRSDLVKTAVISVFTGIIAIILMWILFQIG